jgi:hypothetical protein
MRLAVELKLRRDDVCARRLPTGSNVIGIACRRWTGGTG